MNVDGGNNLQASRLGENNRRLRFSKISPGVPPMGKHRDEEAACID